MSSSPSCLLKSQPLSSIAFVILWFKLAVLCYLLEINAKNKWNLFSSSLHTRPLCIHPAACAYKTIFFDMILCAADASPRGSSKFWGTDLFSFSWRRIKWLFHTENHIHLHYPTTENVFNNIYSKPDLTKNHPFICSVYYSLLRLPLWT